MRNILAPYLLVLLMMLTACSAVMSRETRQLPASTSFDQVWVAAVRSLSQMGMVTVNSDKEGGIIVAEGGRSLFLHNSPPQLSIAITESEGKIQVECTGVLHNQGYGYGTTEKLVEDFFRNLQDQLGSSV